MNQSVFDLLPAIDIASGQAVRLTRGQLESSSEFGSPIEVAFQFVNAGASWIHLVDLDAAFGRGQNRAELTSVVKAFPEVRFQVSGGIQDQESLEFALEVGAARVNLATAALAKRAFVEKALASFGQKLLVALDVDGTLLKPRGSKLELGDLFEALDWLEQAGCQRYVLTDVTRDGAMTGPNLKLLEKVLSRIQKPVIASGGISSLEDLRALLQLSAVGLEGAILGKALYAGRFTMEQALEITSR